MGFFSKLFSSKSQAVKIPGVDVEKVVSEIRRKEDIGKVSLGKKIHSFEYAELEVRFDRDITHNGRFTIYEGEEKIFSFTVFAKEGEYNILNDALNSVIEFLKSDQSIKNLPDNQVVKGFFHRH